MSKPQTWPVAEIFGPTVQGEGIDQGAVVTFVRFGGCDFKCSWCDTPTDLVRAEVLGCAACNYRETRPRSDGLTIAPPERCPHCNP